MVKKSKKSSNTSNQKSPSNLDEAGQNSSPGMEADIAAADTLGAKGTTQAGLTRITAIGHAVWLMSRSPMHKHMFMTDLEWLVTPPVLLNQFRMWQKDGSPIGYASWAYLNEDAEARIRQGIRRLMPTDWKSGETLWLIDFLTPFGGQEQMIKELKEKVFKGKPVKMLQPAPDGKTGVVEW